MTRLVSLVVAVLGMSASAADTKLCCDSPAGIWETEALPKTGSAGTVKGLRARGGLEVDRVCHDGQIVEARLRSELGSKCIGRYRDKIVRLKTLKQTACSFDCNLAAKQ